MSSLKIFKEDIHSNNPLSRDNPASDICMHNDYCMHRQVVKWLCVGECYRK